jgi:hypothetical protein
MDPKKQAAVLEEMLISTLFVTDFSAHYRWTYLFPWFRDAWREPNAGFSGLECAAAIGDYVSVMLTNGSSRPRNYVFLLSCQSDELVALQEILPDDDDHMFCAI